MRGGAGQASGGDGDEAPRPAAAAPAGGRRAPLRCHFTSHWAQHRLSAAEKDRDQLGPLTGLRRRGRLAKADIEDRLDRFTAEVGEADALIERRRATAESLRHEVAATRDWDLHHAGDRTRLAALDRELGRDATMTQPADPYAGLLDQLRMSPSRGTVKPPTAEHDLGIDLGL